MDNAHHQHRNLYKILCILCFEGKNLSTPYIVLSTLRILLTNKQRLVPSEGSPYSENLKDERKRTASKLATHKPHYLHNTTLALSLTPSFAPANYELHKREDTMPSMPVSDSPILVTRRRHWIPSPASVQGLCTLQKGPGAGELKGQVR
jgi:hypothetical protein